MPRSEQELEAIRLRLHEIVWPLLMNDPSQNNEWKLKGGKDKCTTGLVYRGKHKKLGVIWKLECELDISVEQFKTLFVEKLKPTEWAPHVAEYKVLEVAPDESWEISYTLSTGVPTVDDRDFVNVRFRQISGDGSIYELTEAITHPDCPKRKGVVRGEYQPSGCLIRPLPENPEKCHLLFINNLDLKGLLPDNIVRMATTDFLVDFTKALIAKVKQETGRGPPLKPK